MPPPRARRKGSSSPSPVPPAHRLESISPRPHLRSKRALATAKRLLFMTILGPLFLYTFSVLSPDRFSRIDSRLTHAKSIMWVIAHPDDEAFFFAPSILNLLGGRPLVEGHLLCLSTGDHEGAGSIRVEELKASCGRLGISPEQCLALDHPSLPDSPTLWWPASTVNEIVRGYVERWKIDLIVTFDDYGVSGHANHRALSSALSQATSSLPLTFSVKSTPLPLKYLSLLSLPFSFLKRQTAIFISTPSQYAQTRSAFRMHQSQKRWFRSLFITFSRYLWFVELEEMGT